MKKENNNNLIDITNLSKLLMISDRRIQQLAKDGVIIKAGRGKYDYVRSVQGYIKYLTALSQGTTLSIQEERAGLIHYQKEIAKMDYEEKQKSLVPVKQVEEEAAECATMTRDSFQLIPERLKQQKKIDEDTYTLFKKEIESVLNELSN